MSPSPIDRPANRAAIQAYLKALPKRLRWRNAIHSKAGRFALALSASLLIAGLWSLTSHALFYFYMAEANEYRIQGNSKLARENYATALNFRQTADTYVSLAVACESQADTNCAISSLKKAIELSPNEAAAYFNLASIYEAQQNYQLALDFYEKAAKLPDTIRFDAINNIARLRLLQSQQDKAVALLDPIVNEARDLITKAAIYKNLAWAAYEDRQFTKAQALLSESARLDPKRAATYCLWALVERALGQDSLPNTITCLNLPTPPDQPEVAEWKMDLILPPPPQPTDR